jgi:DNA-binding NarL/FixJ family response regulator
MESPVMTRKSHRHCCYSSENGDSHQVRSIQTRHNNMNRISVLIVEDHKLMREGIQALLEPESGIEVLGEAKDGREAVAMAIELRPDVLLMDIAMSGLNGLEATQRLARMLPESRIIILTAHCDDTYLQSAVESGAAGFLLKQDCSRDVCRAIREVHQGRNFYSELISHRLTRINVESPDRAGSNGKKASLLTSREREVLQLIAEGKANKETAAELGISIKTVEKHRGQLMRKLDIHDTAGLTRHAIATGVIESSVQATTL